MLKSNLHIVDQYAQLTQQLKELTAEANALKAEISAAMGEEALLPGDMYQAKQTLTTRKGSIDTKALENIGVTVDHYRKPDTAVYSLKIQPLVH